MKNLKRVSSFMAILFFASIFVFAQESEGKNVEVEKKQAGVNAVTGLDLEFSFLGNGLVNYDLLFDYEFSNEIALGLGSKVGWNFLQNGYESHYFILPYFYVQFVHFYMNLGISLDPELMASSQITVLPYLSLGGRYLWNIGYGKLGLIFGSDLFFSLADLSDDADDSAEKAVAAAVGAIFSVFNIPKIFVGIRYEIPLWTKN